MAILQVCKLKDSQVWEILRYLNEKDKSDSQAFQSAIVDFQQRYKLIPTGLIDFPTFNLLMM